MTPRTVLVTGAASGIGLASVHMLRQDGARVLAFDIQGDRMADELGDGDDSLAIVTGDISDPAACEGAVAAALERCNWARDVLSLITASASRAQAPATAIQPR